MTAEEVIDDVASGVTVATRHGCKLISFGGSPYQEDVQALLRAYDYRLKGKGRLSTRLAKQWDCQIVVCDSWDHEQEVLEQLEAGDAAEEG